MLDLFGHVPQPQFALLLVSIFKMFWIGNHFGRQDRGNMLNAQSCDQMGMLRHRSDTIDHTGNCLFQTADIKVAIFQMFVEAVMLPAVDGFLLDESTDLPLQFGRHALAEFLQRIDEEYLAFGKSDRKGVEKSRSKGIAVNPAAPVDHGTGKVSVARPDEQVGRGRALIVRRNFGRCLSSSRSNVHIWQCTSQYFI